MRNDRGAVLLEVLAALVILATAGMGLVALVSAGLRGERDARDREQVLAKEERLLGALTLLRRSELDQRLGRRQIGDILVDIQRPEPALYRIALLLQSSPDVEDLVTVVYRRETAP